MKITILGSGTGWFYLKRNASGILLTHENFHFLLEMGPGILRQILKIGLTPNDLSAIFISHFHLDHISDLFPFLFATKYGLGYTRKEPFYLLVHRNFEELYKRLQGAFGSWIIPPDGLMNLILLESGMKVELGPFILEVLKVNHNPESLALKVETGTKSLVYSGDTGFCEELIEFSKGVDLLIIECANSEEISVPIHLGPEEIAEIASKANPKRLLLTHFYPHSEKVNLSVIQSKYSGEILLAEDFLTLEP